MLRRSVDLVNRSILGVLLVAVMSACDQRQGLLDPDAGATTAEASPLLPVDSVLRNGVVLRIGLRGHPVGKDARVFALLVDSALNVAWRSAPAGIESGMALVTLRDLPRELHGKRWLLTAAIEHDGMRVYAHSDTAGATTLGAARFRDADVYAGESIQVGGMVRSLAASGTRLEAYFAVVGGGAVGVLDLAAGRVASLAATGPGEVWDVDVAGGTLAYLADAGSRVRFIRLSDGFSDSTVLGPLDVLVTRTSVGAGGEVEVDSVADMVRPYATRLRLACMDEQRVCATPVAMLTSPTQGGGSVVRIASPFAALPALLVADHVPLAGSADSVEASIRVQGPRWPDGHSEAVLERAGVAGCASVRLGFAGFDISEARSAFSLGGEGCGPGGRVTRIDGVLDPRPTLSRLGLATMAAEDRIRAPVEVLSSRDGTRVLVREVDVVWLLDRDLRVLGFTSVTSRARVAWVASAEGAAPRFVIADDGRLDVFEADRFGREKSVAAGPLAGSPLVAVPVSSDGGLVAVFVPAGGTNSLVTVRITGG